MAMRATVSRSMALEKARFDDISRLRRFVTDACGEAHAGAGVSDALELAVDEACTNIIEHGYLPGQGGPVELVFQCDGDEVRVHIADRGKAFPLERVRPPDTTSAWTRRQPGGLGWHLIQSMVDVVRYESTPDGWNRLTLGIRRPPHNSPAETKELS